MVDSKSDSSARLRYSPRKWKGGVSDSGAAPTAWLMQLHETQIDGNGTSDFISSECSNTRSPFYCKKKLAWSFHRWLTKHEISHSSPFSVILIQAKTENQNTLQEHYLVIRYQISSIQPGTPLVVAPLRCHHSMLSRLSNHFQSLVRVNHLWLMLPSMMPSEKTR